MKSAMDRMGFDDLAGSGDARVTDYEGTVTMNGLTHTRCRFICVIY